MSKKGPAYRKEREKRKKEARKAEEARKRTSGAQPDATQVLKNLRALFQDDAAHAVQLATSAGLPPEEVATRLGVPVDRVSRMLELVNNLPNGIRERLVKNPEVLLNKAVLDAAQKRVFGLFGS